MSKSSQKKKDKPIYRDHGKPAWYREQPQFPKGRDPYTDLFKDDMVAEIIRSISTKMKPDLKALQADLRHVAHDYLIVALTAPFGIRGGPKGMTRDQRKRWLESNILKPARKLLSALSVEHNHQLFEWSEDRIGHDPDKEALIRELERLLKRVDAVHSGIAERGNDRTDVLTEFKMDFADALRELFMKHYPDLPNFISEYDTAKRQASEYYKFMRLCADEVFKGDLVLAVDVVDGITVPKRKK